MFITELSSAIRTGPAASVSGTMCALERKGFLRIVVDDDDRRVRRLETTARNREVWARRSATDQERVLEWFAELGADEARTLFQLLLRLEVGVHTALEG